MTRNLDFSTVKAIVMGELSPYFDKTGIDREYFDIGQDLLKSGLIDSLDFLDLIEAIEANHDLTFDLAEVTEPSISKLECLVNEIVYQNGK